MSNLAEQEVNSCVDEFIYIYIQRSLLYLKYYFKMKTEKT